MYIRPPAQASFSKVLAVRVTRASPEPARRMPLGCLFPVSTYGPEADSEREVPPALYVGGYDPNIDPKTRHGLWRIAMNASDHTDIENNWN